MVARWALVALCVILGGIVLCGAVAIGAGIAYLFVKMIFAPV